MKSNDPVSVTQTEAAKRVRDSKSTLMKIMVMKKKETILSREEWPYSKDKTINMLPDTAVLLGYSVQSISFITIFARVHEKEEVLLIHTSIAKNIIREESFTYTMLCLHSLFLQVLQSPVFRVL